MPKKITAIKCVGCGELFEVPKWRRDRAKYCTFECYVKNKPIKRKKPVCSKKGLDFKWSKKVKEVADYKCEICGGTTRLNSHHVIGRRNHATRWWLSNGVCLCVKHHMFGVESAHQNSIWFIDKMIKLRGQEWMDNLIKKGNEKIKWQNELENIRKELERL